MLWRKKYIICNADEGDPGAFMDRSILEGDPMPLEGMPMVPMLLGQMRDIFMWAESLGH